MPAFSLLALLHSYRDLDPVVQIAWPLAFALVIGIGYYVRRASQLDAERADREADQRAAWYVAQQTRSARIHRAIKGDGPGKAA